MKIEDQVKQLTELMADLVPAVDKLASGQEKMEKNVAALIYAVDKLAKGQEKMEINITALIHVADILVTAQEKTNLEMSEMRLSNRKLADAIERLVMKIDKIDQLEDRPVKLERSVFK
jgi:hypothetical protein